MKKVIKTTFDAEQQAKDEAFLQLTPIERLKYAFKLRELMKSKDVNYSYKGQKVKVIHLS